MYQPDPGTLGFVGYLRGLAERDDRGSLAALRRGLGKPPGTSPEMYPYVIPHLPDHLPHDDEWVFYVVASLFATHPVNWSRDTHGAASNFGGSFRHLRSTDPDTNQALDRRFTALLDSARVDLPERLRHAVRLLHTDNTPVDWTRLLTDIRRWEHRDRFVQRAWARTYWTSPTPPSGPS